MDRATIRAGVAYLQTAGYRFGLDDGWLRGTNGHSCFRVPWTGDCPDSPCPTLIRMPGHKGIDSNIGPRPGRTAELIIKRGVLLHPCLCGEVHCLPEPEYVALPTGPLFNYHKLAEAVALFPRRRVLIHWRGAEERIGLSEHGGYAAGFMPMALCTVQEKTIGVLHVRELR